MKLKNKLWIDLKKKKFCHLNKLDTNGKNFLIYPKIYKAHKKYLKIKFNGVSKSDNIPKLKILNRKGQIIGNISLNSESFIDMTNRKYYFILIYTETLTNVDIKEIEIEEVDNIDCVFEKLSGDTLLVTPGYPNVDNKYLCGFVHTRVKAYQKENWNIDVLCIDNAHNVGSYEYEDVKVMKGNFYFLRQVLQNKKYKKILIHFFDENYANVLESIDTSDTKLYFYLHGAETLYRDWSKFASHYFEEETRINDELEEKFQIKDYYIKKYSKIKNAKWIFVTDFTKERCEELLDIKFNNYDVIPCLVDTDLFYYEKKDIEQRKKIFVLRKFDDYNSYSIDTVVRIILELSHREIFNDLEFDIYGDGSLHDKLLMPIRQFKNVHVHKKFLTHEEIKEVHKTHGIALFPTRFDSQAVSSCEAASSGCAVITSDIPGVRQFIPDDLGVMCRVENYKEYANVIEKMYNNPDYFLKVAELESKSVQDKFGYKNTILKEIKMFENEKERETFTFKEIKDPVLTVIVPSYNVKTYLPHTIYSMIDQENANKLEILIVNDGSKDNTLTIAKELENRTKINDKSIVRVIDKENGGHGSTINVGIKEAKGKYIKIVDGDDTVDSEEFKKLIDVLENEECDIVLNNYVEDYAQDNTFNIKKIYTQLKPEIEYHFDDICYENYGFSTWGPILSCSSYKREMLQNGNFKLSEKMFYVDMELNINVAILCDTIKYYDLNVYRYLLGRNGQSVSKESYKRNYKHHENVCINMIEIYQKNYEKLSNSKRNYIVNHLIIPMLNAQYDICIEYFNKGKPFREFNKRLKKYSNFYKHNSLKIKKINFHRKTNGYFIVFLPLIRIPKKILFKILNKLRKRGIEK